MRGRAHRPARGSTVDVLLQVIEAAITEIAERAGLTRRSFFRYFPDKREVLFAGSDQLLHAIERRLEVANPDEAETEALRVLDEAGAFLLRDARTQRRRQKIIASSIELQERERTKTADIGAAIARSVTRRGDADAALIGVLPRWPENHLAPAEVAFAER